MPLDKSSSKKAFSKNIAAERNAGKPEAQSVAIAYSVKRQAERKKFGARDHLAHTFGKLGHSGS